MSDIVIVGAARTAIGKFGGSISKVPAGVPMSSRRHWRVPGCPLIRYPR